MKIQQKKMGISICIKNGETKGNENEGIVEYGNDFISC